MIHDHYRDPHRHYRSEVAWRAAQEDLDRADERRERTMLMDEIYDSPLPRVILQRLRNARDEGRTIRFRSEFSNDCGAYFACVAQADGAVPVVIFRDKSLREFQKVKVWIQDEWERLTKDGNE